MDLSWKIRSRVRIFVAAFLLGIAVGVFVAVIAGILLMFRILPSSFVPDEDQGYFFVVAQVQAVENNFARSLCLIRLYRRLLALCRG